MKKETLTRALIATSRMIVTVDLPALVNVFTGVPQFTRGFALLPFGSPLGSLLFNQNRLTL